MVEYKKSIIEKINFHNIDFYLKRDDLISDEFSGNKARKLDYFLNNPPPNISSLLSYGSNQSNAMSSFSYLALKMGWKFYYYCDHVSSYLSNNPSGNYLEALNNGMIIVTKEQFFTMKEKDDTLYIPEGGACKEAEIGIQNLHLRLSNIYRKIT